MKIFIFGFLILIISGCSRGVQLQTMPDFKQKHFLIDFNGIKSQIFTRKGENFYHFVWLDIMKAPIARKFLKFENCAKDSDKICAKFENDGFLPPNKNAENLFLNLLENIEKKEFELNLQGQIYKVKNAILSK